jgi:hypothetical protein
VSPVVVVVVVVVVVEAFEEPLQLTASSRVDNMVAHIRVRARAERFGMDASLAFVSGIRVNIDCEQASIARRSPGG